MMCIMITNHPDIIAQMGFGFELGHRVKETIPPS
jgi:hypothetical protein